MLVQRNAAFFMTYFNELHAPDLSGLTPSLTEHLINGMLFNGKNVPIDPKLSRLLTGYVLVTDKAIREYTEGRKILVAYTKSQNKLLLMFEGLGRIENCINSVKRALRLLDRIKSEGSELIVDRTLRKLAQSSGKHITLIRDAIEHIDGDIMGTPTLDPGDAHLLAIDHEGRQVEIGKESMTFDALARSLRNLHATAIKMLDELPQRQ